MGISFRKKHHLIKNWKNISLKVHTWHFQVKMNILHLSFTNSNETKNVCHVERLIKIWIRTFLGVEIYFTIQGDRNIKISTECVSWFNSIRAFTLLSKCSFSCHLSSLTSNFMWDLFLSTLFISIEYSIWGVFGTVDYFHKDNNSCFQRLAPIYFLTINSASGITLEAKSVVGVNWNYSIDVSTSWWSGPGKLPQGFLQLSHAS